MFVWVLRLWEIALTFVPTGSWAFLIGSLIQLYESVAKHPVEKMKES